jgi:hypothetical protein
MRPSWRGAVVAGAVGRVRCGLGFGITGPAFVAAAKSVDGAETNPVVRPTTTVAITARMRLAVCQVTSAAKSIGEDSTPAP